MKWLLGILLAFALVFPAQSQDSPYRKEQKRADLTGTNMEVITSIVEIQPGQTFTSTTVRSRSMSSRAVRSRVPTENKCLFPRALLVSTGATHGTAHSRWWATSRSSF
jgi:hypothetical protein